jgi:hypothetical protein
MVFTDNGCNDIHPNAKCVIFPKGKTTWEGFQRPFKDGDIIYVKSKKDGGIGLISIFKKESDTLIYDHCCVSMDTGTFILNGRALICKNDIGTNRHATEEEKQKLFDAIKANGYRWNAEIKTLQKVITLKFKIGDKIKLIGKNTYARIIGIRYEENDVYYETLLGNISIKDQDNYELAPNKFDITTMKPFDKVLVRDSNEDLWSITMYSHYAADKYYPFVTIFVSYPQCIPYEGNEHLLGKADDCADYYKTWK